MNQQIKLITTREYLTQVRKKSFVVITLLAPLLLLAFVGMMTWIFSANEGKNSIAVVDENHLFSTEFVSNPTEIYSFYDVMELPKLKKELPISKTMQAILYIPKTTENYTSIQENTALYTNRNMGGFFLQSIQNKLNKRIEALRLQQNGINPEILDSIKGKLSLKITNLKDDSKEESLLVKEFLAGGLMYIVFMFIIIYGVRVMRSVIEEKNNRVVEIIISSVKPFNLMIGKILGTTFVALTQFLIWIIMVIALMLAFQAYLGHLPATMPPDILNGKIPTDYTTQINQTIDALFQLNYIQIITVFLFCFFGGYLFYSSLFAAIGAAVDNDTETQQFTPIAVVPLSLAFYGSLTIINNPDGLVAFWLSMIPFTSPIAMIARIPYGVPLWQIVLSFVILSISIIAMVFVASKIYRIGILMYGNKPSLKEIWRWIKY